jgi:hypothetical protein
MLRWMLLVVLSGFALCAGSALADSPTTQPIATTRPAVALAADSPIRAWYADLASPDSVKRDNAQTQLMGITRDELSSLQTLIKENGPPAPAQVAALHDIVVQVYLSEETYTPEVLENGKMRGFLGLRWTSQLYNIDNFPRLGVPVEERLAGFPSFRMLRQSDLITGVYLQPDNPIQQLPNMTTPTLQILQRAVAEAGANRDIVLEVIRQGQVIRVAVRVMPRPKLPNELDVVEAFANDRQKKGEDYWQKEFVPLLRPDAS